MSIEIPPALQWVSYLAGSKWPQGDEDGLWRIGEHWHASATEMSDLIPDLNRVRNETMSVIAKSFYCSERSIYRRVRQLYDRFEVPGRTELRIVLADTSHRVHAAA